jgi:hypothetical protein
MASDGDESLKRRAGIKPPSTYVKGIIPLIKAPPYEPLPTLPLFPPHRPLPNLDHDQPANLDLVAFHCGRQAHVNVSPAAPFAFHPSVEPIHVAIAEYLNQVGRLWYAAHRPGINALL